MDISRQENLCTHKLSFGSIPIKTTLVQEQHYPHPNGYEKMQIPQFGDLNDITKRRQYHTNTWPNLIHINAKMPKAYVEISHPCRLVSSIHDVNVGTDLRDNIHTVGTCIHTRVLWFLIPMKSLYISTI